MKKIKVAVVTEMPNVAAEGFAIVTVKKANTVNVVHCCCY
jgi:hypothetical protein